MLLEVASALVKSASFSLGVGACNVGRWHSGAGRDASDDGWLVSVLHGPGIARGGIVGCCGMWSNGIKRGRGCQPLIPIGIPTIHIGSKQ